MSQMSNTDQALSRAYDLIEQEQQSEALAILKPLLTEDPNNPGVWWLYAHAVDNADTAREAISTVLRLDPDYPGATDLKQSLDAVAPAAKTPTISRLATPATLPAEMKASAAASSDLFDDDMPDLGTATPVTAAESNRGGSRLPLLLGVALVAVILIVGAVLFLGQPPAPAVTNTPASVAQNLTPTDLPAPSTDEAVETEAAPTEDAAAETEEAEDTEVAATEVEPSEVPDVETEEVPATTEVEVTAEANTAGEGDSLTAVFADFALDTEPTELSESDLGDTLLVRICGSLSGSALRTTLMEGMTVLAEESANIDDVDAIGIRVIDCEGNSASRAFAVPMDVARDFAQGDLEAAAFQGSWRPVA